MNKESFKFYYVDEHNDDTVYTAILSPYLSHIEQDGHLEGLPAYRVTWDGCDRGSYYTIDAVVDNIDSGLWKVIDEPKPYPVEVETLISSLVSAHNKGLGLTALELGDIIRNWDKVRGTYEE